MKQIKILSIVAFIMMVVVTLLSNVPTVRAASSQAITWSIAHTFSGTGWALLTCWTDPDNVHNNCYNIDNSDGTVSYGGLQVTNGFSTIGRQFSVTPVATGRVLSCYAKLQIRPSQFGASHFPINGKLEIIDVNTWTYITLKTFAIYGQTNFVHVSTASWNPPNKNIFARIVLIGDGTANTLEFDNLAITCTY